MGVASGCRNTIWNRIVPSLMSQKKNIYLGGSLADVELVMPWHQSYDILSPTALKEFSLFLKAVGIDTNLYSPAGMLPHNIVQKILHDRYPEIYRFQYSTAKEDCSEKNLGVSLSKMYHGIDFRDYCSEKLFVELLKDFVQSQITNEKAYGLRNHRRVIRKEMCAIIYHMQDHPLFSEVRSQIPSSWKGRWIDFIHSYTVPDIDSRFMEVYNEYATDIDDHPDSERMMHVNVKN